MKKTNKLLSIILAILMIVTTVPMAFAAESDGVKTILDVSKGRIVIADTYVTENGEDIALDPDGYIITGESNYEDTVLEFLNESYDSVTYNVVFDNLYILADYYCTALRFKGKGPMVVNAELIGTNYVGTVNHAMFSNQGESTLIVNLTIAEDASLKITRNDNSDEIYYSNSTELYINGEKVGKDGHIHAGGDGTQYCLGYKCGICGDFYGENSDEHKLVNNICQYCGYVPDGFIKITMKDSCGDGWSGNAVVIYSVKDDVRTEVGTATFDYGEVEYFALLREEDTDYAFAWKNGTYIDECSFSISFAGDSVYSIGTDHGLEDGYEFFVLHSYDYEVTTPAKCEANAMETGICTVCGVTTDERVVEDSALGHADENGDYKCDNGCGHEFEKPADETCPDCGRPAHGDGLMENIICWFVMLINLVKSMFA